MYAGQASTIVNVTDTLTGEELRRYVKVDVTKRRAV